LAIASGNVFSLPKMEELPESLRSLPAKPDIKLIRTHIQRLQDFQARQVARASIVEALPTATLVVKSLKAQVAEKYMQTRFVDLEDLYFRLHNLSLDTYSQKLDVPSDSR
jgi:phosphoenolpyruvate-protein kinase (PTS system EI component)